MCTVALAVSGCAAGAEPPPEQGAPPSEVAPSPQPGELAAFPDHVEGLPETLPALPDDAFVYQVSFNEATHHGAESAATLSWEQLSRVEADSSEVWEFFERTLPQSGYEVGNGLAFSGHGVDGVIRLRQREELLYVTTQLWWHLDPGSVPVPSWFDEAMPPMPERAARWETKLVQEVPDPPAAPEVELRVHHRMADEPVESDFDDLVEQMAEVVPQAGWVFTGEEDNSRIHEGQGDLEVDARSMSLHYHGFGALLEVRIMQDIRNDHIGVEPARVLFIFGTDQG